MTFSHVSLAFVVTSRIIKSNYFSPKFTVTYFSQSTFHGFLLKATLVTLELFGATDWKQKLSKLIQIQQRMCKAWFTLAT